MELGASRSVQCEASIKTEPEGMEAARNSSTVDWASARIILYPTEASDDDRPEGGPLRLVIAAGAAYIWYKMHTYIRGEPSLLDGLRILAPDNFLPHITDRGMRVKMTKTSCKGESSLYL